MKSLTDSSVSRTRSRMSGEARSRRGRTVGKPGGGGSGCVIGGAFAGQGTTPSVYTGGRSGWTVVAPDGISPTPFRRGESAYARQVLGRGGLRPGGGRDGLGGRPAGRPGPGRPRRADPVYPTSA